jgi:hypothetical protein
MPIGIDQKFGRQDMQDMLRRLANRRSARVGAVVERMRPAVTHAKQVLAEIEAEDRNRDSASSLPLKD